MRFPTMWYVQSLRPACAYTQSDQSLCYSQEYSMRVKLLTEQHMEFLSCTDLPESTLIKMPHCWKSHVTAKLYSPCMFIKTLAVKPQEPLPWFRIRNINTVNRCTSYIDFQWYPIRTRQYIFRSRYPIFH